MRLDLSAPSQGQFQNILFFQDKSDNHQISFTGNGGGTVNGIFYAPKAPMTLSGNGSGSLNADIVVDSLAITGNATIHEFVPLAGGPFTNPTLVE